MKASPHDRQLKLWIAVYFLVLTASLPIPEAFG
jgi:hypothetical protein